MSRPSTSRSGIERIADAFATARQEARCALVTYLMLGYPTAEASLELVPALQAGGADLIELGVPFSDPVADGPTIQQAGQIALRAGVTPRRCLRLVSQLRERGVTVPLVLMGYYNPIHAAGMTAYVKACAAAGVDGLIVPDLPPEEADPLREACLERGLALVFLVAPTTSEARAAWIAKLSTGFLYVVSRLGITGSALRPGVELVARLQTVRRHSTLPVAVGFGISRPDQVRALATQADGIIVGSAVVERATEGAGPLRDYVASLRAAMVR